MRLPDAVAQAIGPLGVPPYTPPPITMYEGRRVTTDDFRTPPEET